MYTRGRPGARARIACSTKYLLYYTYQLSGIYLYPGINDGKSGGGGEPIETSDYSRVCGVRDGRENRIRVLIYLLVYNITYNMYNIYNIV